MFQYLSVLWIVIMTYIGMPIGDLSRLRVLSSFVFISQLTKLILDWCRLFDSTSFYVTLILQTMNDIKEFTFILFIIIIYFGAAFYMVKLNYMSGDQEILSTISGFILIDSFLNEYLLSLGEF